jgi:hypothetical protein
MREVPAGGSAAADHEADMELLTPEEAARIVRLSPVTLRNMRCERRGPTPTYMGRRVYYLRRSLLLWLEAEAARQAREWAVS